jgi:hypothetical protein
MKRYTKREIEVNVFHASNGKTIAESSFAGKKFRGVSKCNPEDLYSNDFGDNLAAYRSILKMSKYKNQLANKRLTERAEDLFKAIDRYAEAFCFCRDSEYDLEIAKKELQKLYSIM